jgi:hypothetical protein
MTVVSDSDSQPAPHVDLDLPEPESRPRRQLPSIQLPEFLKRATWRFYVFTPILVVLVLAVPILAWKGTSILRNENIGEGVEPVDDPKEPGFEALVTPTPTTLLLDIAPDRTLQGVTLITLPSQEGGGNIIFMPVGTVLPVPLRDPAEAQLREIYAEGGVSALEQRIETMLGAAVTEVVQVPRAQWANLVEPVAPLTVQNPTAVTTTNNAGETVSFAEGEIQLAPPQVGLYLQADTEDQADTVRISRHEAFWTAWLAALDEAGESAVPGEGETGVGGVVRGLIGGPRNMLTLPVTPIGIPGVPAIESDLFRPIGLAIAGEVPTWIPFPTGVGRLRTRLVLGVEDEQDVLPETAHRLVQAGAEIGVVANADAYGVRRTQVVFFRENQREKAQRLLDALGVGTLVKDAGEGETFDVVIVLGQDYIDSIGGETTATTTPGGLAPPTSVPTGGLPSNGIPGGVTTGAPGGETTG